jgi:hypothetical protein
MKGIKVIDVGTNPEYDVEFGTCEVCLSYGNEVDNPYMVLEFTDGTQAKVDTYYWDWGDYFESSVDNVVDFSAWLSEQDLSDEDVEELKSGDKSALIRLIDEYNYRLEETDE